MNKQVPITDSHQALAQAIASGQLSGPLLERAEGILERLERPLRLSVMGLPGSGKSTLLNLLLGKTVFDPALRLPTTSVTYGEAAMAECTLSDGSKKVVEGAKINEIAALHPAFVEMQLPLPSLKKLSMMEVVVGDVPAQQHKALSWAAKRTDIGIWCTSSFSSKEQALWERMPERIQDHSFLLLTKADLLSAQGHLDQQLSAIDEAGGDYFKDVLSIDTVGALSARKSDGTPNKEAMRSSGGMKLISSILKDVELGRSAALDSAEVFLHQVDFSATEPAAEETPKEEAEAKSKAAPAPELENTSEPEAAADVEEQRDVVAPAAPEEPALELLSEPSRDAFSEAVDRLTKVGAELTAGVSSGEMSNDEVVEQTFDTVVWLSEHLQDRGEAKDPGMAQICDAAFEASDLVQLIQLESGDGLAADAVSVMVQLKQDMQMALSA